MKVLITLLSITLPALAGIIHQHGEHEEDHKQATSYQKIHIEHFHPIPTIFKKEFAELIKNPIHSGDTKSSLEVHHGGKHDYGYAIAHVESNVDKGFDFDDSHQEYKQIEYKEEEPSHRQEEAYDYSHYQHALARENEDKNEQLLKESKDEEDNDEGGYNHQGLGYYKS